MTNKSWMSQSTRYQTGTSCPFTTSELVVFDYEIDSKILTEIDSKIATAKSEISTEIDSKIATAMPNGAIIMWSGSTPPPGWTLCDGNGGNKINNVTIPDLRGRFIVGAGGTYEIDAIGGTEMVTLTESQLPSHSHTGETGAMSKNESHSHSVPGNKPGGTAVGIIFEANLEYTNAALGVSSFPIVAGKAINETSVAHTHPFTTDSIGSNQAHENRPPYYALAYIIKTN